MYQTRDVITKYFPVKASIIITGREFVMENRGKEVRLKMTETVDVKLDNTMQAIPLIEACKDWFVNFEVVNGTMDDAFLRATGANEDDGREDG